MPHFQTIDKLDFTFSGDVLRLQTFEASRDSRISHLPETADSAGTADAVLTTTSGSETLVPLTEISEPREFKGVSWFGFETTNFARGSFNESDLTETSSSLSENSGHFTQVVWADTRGAPEDAYPVFNNAKIVAPNAGVPDFDADYRQDPPMQQYEQVIYGTSDDDVLFGGSGGDMIFGFEGNDLIHGGGGDDLIAGYYNSNTLYGDHGDDTVVGGTDNDDLFGGFGNDELRGESGNDFLAGNEDHDLLSGGEGDDELFGGEGHDVLAGGLGLDEMTGGSGIDVFRWGHATEDDGGKDTITDFEIGTDQFQFVTAWGQDSFFDTSLGGSVSDVLTALDNGNDTELLANTATDGWTVIANLLNTDHDAIQQRIDDGSILYDYGAPVFDVPDVLLS